MSTQDNTKIFRTAAALGEATGLSRWTITAIRKAGRELGDRLPNYATASDLRAWLRRHPDFVAARYFKKRAQPCTV